MEFKITGFKKNMEYLTLKVDESSLVVIDHIKDNQKVEKELLVKITDWYKSHTDAQRALFHKWLDVYYKTGLHSNLSKEDLKQRLKRQANGFIYVKYVDFQFVECSREDQQFIVIKSTSKYNVKEYNNLIDELINDMLKVGAGEELDRLQKEYISIKNNFKEENK